jgi:hypothetical protein
MKKVLSLALLFISFVSLALEAVFEINIYQNNQLVIPETGVYKLEKQPFQIKVSLHNMEGVYVYADFSDSLYRLPHTQPIPGYSQLPAMVMAETQNNADKELLISKNGWAYWFHDGKSKVKRFDSEIANQGRGSFTGTKTVNKFYFTSTQQAVSVQNVTQTLYLFFLGTQKDKKGNPTSEIGRIKYKIEWR